MHNPADGPTLIERVETILMQVDREAYQRGLADGLKVADHICDWLTMQPPRKWAEKVREWGLAAIKKARKE